MRSIHHIALFVAAFAGVVDASHANETPYDYVWPTGNIQQVIGFKTRDGKWVSPNARVLIGMAPIPGARGIGWDRMKIVIDLSQVAQSLPMGCGIRLEAPWKKLRASFPIPTSGGDGPEFSWPASQERKDGNFYQALSWRQEGCSLTAGYSLADQADPRQFRARYPGLDSRFATKAVQIVWLTLEGADKKAEYTMLVPYVEAPFSPRRR